MSLVTSCGNHSIALFRVLRSSVRRMIPRCLIEWAFQWDFLYLCADIDLLKIQINGIADTCHRKRLTYLLLTSEASLVGFLHPPLLVWLLESVTAIPFNLCPIPLYEKK